MTTGGRTTIITIVSRIIYKKIKLYFLKRKVQKALKGTRFSLTDISMSVDRTPDDYVYLTPITDDYKHVKQDCPCAPQLLHRYRDDGSEFWIVKHQPMDIGVIE